MSKWTDFRDDVKNLAEDHPKKVAAVLVIGVVLGVVLSWII
jgi:F0F1-type ATP synthase assembly protein I